VRIEDDTAHWLWKVTDRDVDVPQRLQLPSASVEPQAVVCAAGGREPVGREGLLVAESEKGSVLARKDGNELALVGVDAAQPCRPCWSPAVTAIDGREELARAAIC
jgi:hypothetical protein